MPEITEKKRKPARRRNPDRVTRAFSLMKTDMEVIRQVREEEELTSDSAALRRLIRDGKSFRDIRWPQRKPV